MFCGQHHSFLCVLIACAALIPARAEPSGYILGPDDQVKIKAIDIPEIGDTALRIDLQGGMTIPLIGRVQAGGLTVQQFENELVSRLKKYVKDPQIAVTITEFGSQPVSILGAVNKPGVHQLHGRKTLFEVLSLAEGLRNDASNTIKITRQIAWGKLPLPTAVVDESAGFSVGEVAVNSVLEARNPQENIPIMPNDVITVPKADLVYVVGTVKKSGGFVLAGKKQISALQAVALAEGLDRAAAPDHARIIRGPEDHRTEIPVDLSKVLSGKGPDLPLYANDILFVPSSTAKKVGYRAMETALQLTTGILIWR